MQDVRIAELAGKQFNRISRGQLEALGLSETAVEHRVARGRLIPTETGVYAVAPLLRHDPWGRWMGATLTAPDTHLSRLSACVAFGFLQREGPLTTVTRPGSGGPRRRGKVLAYRSTTLVDSDLTVLNGIPITSPVRTIFDISGVVGDRALARAVREAVRLELTSLYALGDALGRFRRQRGAARLAATIARYSGLPLERARRVRRSAPSKS